MLHLGNLNLLPSFVLFSMSLVQQLSKAQNIDLSTPNHVTDTKVLNAFHYFKAEKLLRIGSLIDLICLIVSDLSS